MNTVIIGIGSNINADNNIPEAIRLMDEIVHVVKQSSFITTEPIGYRHQPNFTNGAVLVYTKTTKDKLNKELKEIECKLKRTKTANKNGPRTIDLDILVWNDKIDDEDVYTRDFLQASIIELCPNLAHLINK